MLRESADGSQNHSAGEGLFGYAPETITFPILTASEFACACVRGSVVEQIRTIPGIAVLGIDFIRPLPLSRDVLLSGTVRKWRGTHTPPAIDPMAGDSLV